MNEDQHSSSESSNVDPSVQDRKPAILVVEDDVAFLDTLCSELREEGFEVVSASSCSAGMALLADHNIWMVLLDWNLQKGGDGDLTGKRLMRLCRKVNTLMPVIVMSGDTSMDVRTDAVLAEADSFLTKPFNIHLLVTHVRRWYKRHQALNARLSLAGENDIIQLLCGLPSANS